MNVTGNPSIDDAVNDQIKHLPFSHEESIAFTVVLFVFCLFGLVANLLAFIVIIRTPKLRENAFNVFLASLCVSDFLSSLNSPFVLYQKIWGFQDFALPELLCKLHVSIDVWTSVTTIQHIMSFALLRVFSIKFPIIFKSISPFHAKTIVCCIWFETAIVVFIPYTIWPAIKHDTIWYSCTMSTQWMFEVKKYMTYGFPFLFYAPMIIIIFTNILIAAMLIHMRITRNKDRGNRGGISEAERSRRRMENMAVTQLVLVMSSFFLGYSSDIGYRLYIINVRLQLATANISSMHLIWLLGIIAHTLLRVSECLNPVLYNLSSSQMRGGTIAFLSSFKNKLCRGGKREEQTHKRCQTTNESHCTSRQPQDQFTNRNFESHIHFPCGHRG